MLEVAVRENGAARRVVFSGDIGQRNKPLVRDPAVFRQADYVVIESTYGDREHEDAKDVETLLAEAVLAAVEAGGNLVIPTFAVERAQELIFHLSRLVRTGRIPHLLVFLDSPMAVDVTDVFAEHASELDEEARRLFGDGQTPFAFPGLKLIRTIEESKAINAVRGTSVIMAGSGMCTGGRIKHHLARNISRPESVILFVGYQARDTLGRAILSRPPEVRIHGQMWPVRARIAKIEGFSAHADRRGLNRWLDALQAPPRELFVTHGDREVSAAFAAAVARTGAGGCRYRGRGRVVSRLEAAASTSHAPGDDDASRDYGRRLGRTCPRVTPLVLVRRERLRALGAPHGATRPPRRLRAPLRTSPSPR
jgi:metallo-beta-lactamase family protein